MAAALLMGSLVAVPLWLTVSQTEGTERGPDMAAVEKATRLQEIVFFREGEGQRRFAQRNFIRGDVVRGEVTGALGDEEKIICREAAREGQVGLRFELAAESTESEWWVAITPEKKESRRDERAPTYFDAYAYRNRGELRFDLRGDVRGKGLGVTVGASSWRRGHIPKLTSLDPYLDDTTDWQHVVIPVKDLDFSTPGTELWVATRIVLGGNGYAGPLRMDLDNIVLWSNGPEPERGPVRVNHVGYLPEQRKVAFVGGSRLSGLEGRPFNVRQADGDGKSVGGPAFTGTLTLRSAFEPQMYGEWLYCAEFSDLTAASRYVLEVPGVGESVPFYIHDAIYDYLYYHLARFFFYQRNGKALPEENAFEWARGEIYTQPIPYLSDPSKTRIVRHGWFDAGDSRLYPHTDRLGPMLLAWELSEDRHFDGQLNIPESGNGVPDLLDEVRYQVEYLREIQHDDGSCPGFLMTGTGNGNPIRERSQGYENDDDPRHIHDTDKPRGGQKTGQVCAAFAMMARCLGSYDADGARVYSEAAHRAWAWIEDPAQAGSLSREERADRLWAAVELWRLTHEDRFHEALRELAQGEVEEAWDGYAWRERKSAWIAWLSYVLDEAADGELRRSFRQRLLQRAETLFSPAASDPYDVVIYMNDYYFGAGDLGRTAGLCALIWRVTGDDRYRQLAEDHLHYICGRNIHRLCAISNVAPESHGEPFHMLEWTPDRKAWMPGYVAYMSVNTAGTLSRFRARRLRVTRHSFPFSEPCVGFNFGPTVAAMLLMDGRRYSDLIERGALPGVPPFRPGLPFAPSTHIPWGEEPVVPEQSE